MKKLTKKLVLNKSTVTEIGKEDQLNIKGGSIPFCDPTDTCHTWSCSVKCPTWDPAGCTQSEVLPICPI